MLASPTTLRGSSTGGGGGATARGGGGGGGGGADSHPAIRAKAQSSAPEDAKRSLADTVIQRRLSLSLEGRPTGFCRRIKSLSSDLRVLPDAHRAPTCPPAHMDSC